jgi:hypothetical protein
MKKPIAIAIASTALLFAAGPQQYTGTISDNMCGADHKSMNMGADATCVTECVKSMGGKYVLWDGKTSWELSDQKGAEKYAARKVTVTGTIDEKAKTLKVDSIAAAQ